MIMDNTGAQTTPISPYNTCTDISKVSLNCAQAGHHLSVLSFHRKNQSENTTIPNSSPFLADYINMQAHMELSYLEDVLS